MEVTAPPCRCARCKRLSGDVTGVVSVADDGGSTGRLRAMLNVAAVGGSAQVPRGAGRPRESARPPPSSTDSSVGELSGHAVGNLLLVGLIDATGDLEESVHAAGPGHGRDGHHRSRQHRGRRAAGHDRRGRHAWTDQRGQVLDDPTRQPRALAPAASIAAVEAIERADVVVIGPGSLFTSVIAACVVPGITQALAGTRRKKIYVANLRAEIPETEGFTLQDHVDALARHGVEVDLVLVDERSPFAHDDATVATVVADLAGEKWASARCAKIGSDCLRECDDRRPQRRRRQWQHGSRLMDSDVSDEDSFALSSSTPRWRSSRSTTWCPRRPTPIS